MTEEIYTYGKFIVRENRFIAKVNLEGVEERVHVPNTGRLPQILTEDALVQLRKSKDPNRKTKYSLIAAKRKGKWVNIDSQLPNRLAYESVKRGMIEEFQGLDLLKREVSYGNSRFDLYYERGTQKGFIEVKGVTYAEEGVGMFPDAPTTRGTKHLHELMKLKATGYEATILFIVMREDCESFQPHEEMDEEFAQALKKASEIGINVLAYRTKYEGAHPKVSGRISVIFP